MPAVWSSAFGPNSEKGRHDGGQVDCSWRQRECKKTPAAPNAVDEFGPWEWTAAGNSDCRLAPGRMQQKPAQLDSYLLGGQEAGAEHSGRRIVAAENHGRKIK